MFPSRARIISITNTNREILTEGAALEDPVEMAKRIDQFAEIMEGVEKVKITSENGTDLELDIKVPSLIKENGIIDRPGMGSNFPTGEYGGAVDLEETNGIYVIDGAIGMIGKPDKPIKLIIRKGKVVEIEGGKSAEKLREILKKANEKYREENPDDKITDAFRLAEFSFGMNSKAFRYTKDGKRISPPTSLEAEKGLGTIHIALGKNSIFNVEKDDPDYNDIPIHIDCVAMNTNVKGIKEDEETVELIKNGKVICL
jgi:leucyl aminopeptidase (aminopeptidase T)